MSDEEQIAETLRRHLIALIRLIDRSWERRYDITITVRRKPTSP